MNTTTTYRQKDNGWQIIVSYKDGKNWRQKSRQGFATKKDAKAYEATLLAQIKTRPQPVDKAMTGITLMEFCATYVKVKKSLAANTKLQYTHAVKSLGALANKPLHQITCLDIQAAVSDWSMVPMTQKMYKNKLEILFRAAMNPYGLISSNPMDHIEIEKTRDVPERITITEEQFAKLLKISKPPVRMAAALCYYTGIRRGEMLALTWKDVDFQGMEITINKQHDIRRNKITELKTKNGYRTIPIPQVLLQMLKAYHDTQPLSIDRRIFPRPHGVYESLLTKMKRVDNRLSPHCLRHTYATHLLARGVDIRTVAALLGDNTQTVINTYVHYSDEMRAAAARDIQKIFAQNF